MENWKEYYKDLGEVREHSTKNVVFEATENTPIIEELRASCGCTKPIYDKEKGTITASFKAGGIPYHLKGQGFYETFKYISVHYANGKMDKLKFKAKIVK